MSLGFVVDSSQKSGSYPGIFEGRGGFCKLGHKSLTVLRDKVKYRH